MNLCCTESSRYFAVSCKRRKLGLGCSRGIERRCTREEDDRGKKNVSVETMVVVAATVPIRNIRPYYMIYLCTAWAVAADDDVYSREEGKSRVHRLRRPLQVVSRCFHYFSFSVLLLTVRLVATVTYAPRHHSSPQSIAKQYLLYHEVLWLGAMPVGVIEFEVFCKTDSLCLIHSAVLTLG